MIDISISWQYCINVSQKPLTLKENGRRFRDIDAASK